MQWIKRVSYKREKQSGRLWRERNEYWLDVSFDFTLSILAFMSFHDLSIEQMEDDLNMEIDLSSRYDYKMSEICKIKHYMILYKEAED